MNKAYLEYTEIDQLIALAENPRDKLLLTLLARLGCRISEALAICVNDIDFEAGSITIRHLKSRIGLKCPDCQARLGLRTTYCPTCGKKIDSAIQILKEQRRMRTLPMDDFLLQQISEFIAAGGPVNKNGKALLFGINRHRAWQIVKTLGETADLPKIINTETGKVHNISPHKLRDAFAVHAVKHNDTGDGLRMLQEHLGHQSFNTTAKYRKVAGEERRRWYDELWKA
jgi:integrase/recombinase XerD